ncbi:Polygalacturonase [Handroanthus impetiginosus]|uniref:Polygalacturonase n=1 Tax=Handroanthus impetiginosus TaxID=429701 RepID=A0A2G9FX96_9LAMI|nr:Polygalacturonase [Handroanthus impetiginosus]
MERKMNPRSRNAFFSIHFILSLPSNFPIATSEPVLDTEGHPVRIGQKYFVVPPLPGAGGGLTLSSTKGHCPYEILQMLNASIGGLPVTFSSVNPKDKVVNLDTDFNIRFIDFKGRCPESKVWKFDANEQRIRRETRIGNWFKNIQKENNKNRTSYKLQYCPSPKLCENKCRVLCGDIGVVVYESKHLAKPSLIKISKVTLKNIRGTSATQEVMSFLCSSAKPCENIEVGDVDLTYTGTLGPATTKCDNIKPILVGKQNPPICATPAQSA